MQEKNGDLSVLPHDVFSEIAYCIKDFNQQTQSAVSRVSNNFYGLFQPKRLLNKFLWAIAKGRQDLAQTMLTVYPKLLLEKGDLTDYSGRKFSGITALQYLFWALDVRYMTSMFLRCLNNNPEINIFKEALLFQYQEVEKSGLTYIWKEQTYQEKHFDFTPLFQSMQDYIDLYLQPSTPKILSQREACWNNRVGTELLNIPAHIAQHYCEVDQPFYPIPNFKNQTLNRTLTFQRGVAQELENWWPEDSEKNRKIFGKVRFGRKFCTAGNGDGRCGEACASDMGALIVLRDTRMADLLLLKNILSTECNMQSLIQQKFP